MACSSCGRAVRAGARFCGACGAALVPRCPACGAENDPELRFCEVCGAERSPAHPADAISRKVVTIVFADLIGSTALHERLDPESVRRLMEAYHGAVRAPIEAHGGTVVQLLGDGVMCAFGVPHVAEDDALRAVRAAVAVQEAFRELVGKESELVGRVGLRVAVNTGEVVVSDDYAAGIGDPLNVAARLQQEAKDGDVLIGEATQRHVRERVTLAPFGTFALKGRSEPVAAFRVVSLERPAGVPATALVGRDDELRRLLAVFEAAVAAPGTRLAVLLGSPGLGKSRLLDEVARRLAGRATVLGARCEAAGSATFAPLTGALRTLLGIEGAPGDDLRAAIDRVVPGAEAERARIAAGIEALLAGTPASPEETFYDVRRLLAALATEQPVVLAIDDLHWAEPLLLDLIEHLVQWGAGVPLLVLAAARPELREARSSLASPGAVAADVVTLAGLDATAATRLAASVIGADALPAAVAGRVLTTSEGNPLFLGELVRMLVNDGVLRREGDHWTLGVALADLDIPPTIQALLAARIERLRPEERLVLERAAVVGRHFSRAALAQLLPRENGDLGARLESLRRSELIEPDTGWFLGEPALRFHHVLIRDAAYRRVLKGTRAELHARLADWIEARAGEHDETLGWHLEQAHQNLRELGTLDERGRALGERAARHLGAAGRRALARDDLPLAASLIGRALDRLDAADPARAELAPDWCEALLASGDVGPAAKAVAELARFSAGSERLRAWHTCFTGQLAVLTDPDALRATAGAVAAAAEVLASSGDAAGEAKAHQVHATALARLGEIGACEAALDRALAAARRAHDRRRANAVLAGAPQAALWGPSPVTRASGRCLDVVRVLRITQGAPAVEAVALRCQAVLEALRGRSDAARRMIASARRMVEELGITQQLLEADVFAGHIDLLEGDAIAAERCLRAAYRGLRDHGLGIDAARAAALLGRALLAQGRATEAEALSHESEALAGDDLKAAIAWRGVRAEALAERGEAAAAVELARAAVGMAAATDGVLDHADARLALAVALRAAGRLAEADAEETRAIELWDQKGATLLAGRARRDAGRATEAVREAEPEAVPAPLELRRVRPNAMTTHAARLNEAIAARDADALRSLHTDGFQLVSHNLGAVLDRQEMLSWWGLLFMEDRDVAWRLEPIATLGDSLALCRQPWTGSASSEAFDMGAFERVAFALTEGDAQGRAERVEVFAADRLGDAVARLYERHAELLPDGPERMRAAATAQSVAAILGPFDLARYATAITPAVEFFDHRMIGFPSGRGANELLTSIGTLVETVGAAATRVEDVLALRSDAFLVRWTTSGEDRSGGGASEWQFLRLCVFGADGLLTRAEQFDPDRAAEALARLDELTAGPPPTPRRVRPNAAIANVARLNAAAAARDLDALASFLSDDLEVVSHTTGAVLDRQANMAWWRLFVADRDAAFRVEPLATLGESLALCHQSWSGSASSGTSLDVGAFEMEMFFVYEVDGEGRAARVEAFGADRLADAIARLYERYAELLPEGPKRTRAVTTARSMAGWSGPLDFDRAVASIAPDVEVVDHRVLGSGSARGADAFRRGFRAWFDLASEIRIHNNEILALCHGALLVRFTFVGTDRATGGSFERPALLLVVSGADGLLTRIELFDSDRAAEALARFDELTAERPPPMRRRVRPNAATTTSARFEAAFAARDEAAIAELFSDPAEVLHHPTGSTWDRQGTLAVFRDAFAGARNIAYREEPLASLRESLALVRISTSSAAGINLGLDVGPTELEQFALHETDEHGRRRRIEVFAADRLGDAIARLYERYAELLPEGLERARAEMTGHFLSIHLRNANLMSESLLPPEFEFVDRRPLGLGRARGAEAFMRAYQLGRDMEEAHASHVRDVIDLCPNATLLHSPMSGIDRSSGGAFERDLLRLYAFAEDGRVARIEWFDPSQEAEALARFDELSREPTPTSRFENAATRALARHTDAWNAHDWARYAASFPPEFGYTDRRSMMLLELDRDAFLDFMRTTFELRTSRLTNQVLATRGDRLALARGHFEGADADLGPSEIESLFLVEVNESGERSASARFDPDALDAAFEELDARYDAGEAAPYASRLARRIERAINARDWEAVASLFAPDLVLEDHRSVGVFAFRSGDEYIAVTRALVELAPDATLRAYHILLNEKGSFGIGGWEGHREGGPFEIVAANVNTWDAEGRIRRIDVYGLDQLDLARARFAELTSAPPASRIENAATRRFDRARDTLNARDWERFVADTPPETRCSDRRAMRLLELDRDAFLADTRVLFEMRSGRWTSEVLATRGDRLALLRVLFEGSDRDLGPSELESLQLVDLNARGEHAAIVRFDPDALDAAYDELDARYDAGEAAPYARTREVLRRLRHAANARDWDEMASVYSPDFVSEDHRPVGVLTFGSGDEYVASSRAVVELAPDAVLRGYHVLALDERRSLGVSGWSGTREGGAFETLGVTVQSLGPDGRIQRLDIYNLDQLDEARARFEALRPDPLRIPPNAAWRAHARSIEAWRARDWVAFRALASPDFTFEDRGKRALVSGGVEMWVENASFVPPGAGESELLGTAGERIALVRVLWKGELDGGPVEREHLRLTELDAEGQTRAVIWFDSDDRGAAFEEAQARFLAGEAAGDEGQAVIAAMPRAFNRRDWALWKRSLTEDCVVRDHRTLGLSELPIDDWLGSLRAWVELAPDVSVEVLRILRWNRHGTVLMTRAFGTRDGGPFEQGTFLTLALAHDGLIQRYEFFDVGDTDRALARFEELCAPA